MEHPPNEQAPDDMGAKGWAVLDLSFFVRPPAFFAGLAYAVGVLVIAAVVLAGLVILYQFVSSSIATPPRDFEEIGKRLLALGVIVAAPFAIWRIVISHWQARAAQDQACAAARQADVAREEHYTTLFTTAVQQLGAMRERNDGDSAGLKMEPNMEARLGAIYALERISQDSERDHWPIMETLCAYVRGNAGLAQELSEQEMRELADGRVYGRWADLKNPRVDVQAALTVIGRRSAQRREYERRLSSEAKDRRSFRLDLSRADLANMRLTGNFDYADFEGTSLAYAEVRGVSFRRAGFLRTHFSGARLDDVDFDQARLIAAHFEGATLRKVTAKDAAAFNVCMDGAHIIESKFVGASFFNIELNGATFSRTTFDGVKMESSELTGVSFEGSDLGDTDITHSIMRAANLINAKCEKVVGLTQEMLNTAYGNKTTTLPDEVSRPPHWPAYLRTPSDMTEYQLKWRKERETAIAARREARAAKSSSDDIPF